MGPVKKACTLGCDPQSDCQKNPTTLVLSVLRVWGGALLVWRFLWAKGGFIPIFLEFTIGVKVRFSVFWILKYTTFIQFFMKKMVTNFPNTITKAQM